MDIKCSKCSKLNHEDAEVCIHCGAQLTESIDNAHTPSERDPAADLLASLRAAGSVDSDSAVPEGGDEMQQESLDSDEDVPDWLMRIRKITEEEDSQKDEWIPSEAEDVPDWLSALAGESDAEDKPGDAAAGEDAVKDTGEPAETFFLAEEEDLTGEAESALDWLQDIEAEQDGADEAGVVLPSKSEEKSPETQDDLPPDLSETLMEGLPNWLQEEDQPAEELPEAPEPLEEDDLLDRLKSFDAGGEDEPEEEPEGEALFPETVVEDATPLASEPVDLEKELEALDFVENEDLTQWIASLQAEIDEGEQPVETAAESSAPPEEISDAGDELISLADFSLESESDEEAPIPAEAPVSPAESPEAADEMPPAAETGEPDLFADEPEAEQPLPEQELQRPDWMSLREEEPSESVESEEDGLPDWMVEPEVAAKAASPAVQDTDSPEDKDDLPGWLFGEETSSKEDDGLDGWKAFDREDAEPKAAEEDLSEWLGDLTPESGNDIFDIKRAEGIAGDAQSETPPFVGQDIGAWMKDEEEELATEGDQPGEEDRMDEALVNRGDDLPDWLDDAAGEAAQETPRREPAAENEEIEQADLPDWLESMRPIDSVLPEKITPVDDKKVEQSGPLAGLRAVLPATPSVGQYRKPPIYSVKLQVSEKQRAHAAMLENLLEEERRAAGRKPKSAKAPLRVVRIVIALFLIAAVLLPILGIPDMSIIPPTTSVAPFYEQIEAIPAGSPVLLAVDYAPGYAGEMAYAGTGVLQRMMLRELRIAAVSTLPTGPVLAEGLKTAVFERDVTLRERYENRDWFINLGFLPGEIISLREFAQYPRQAVQFGLSTGLENRPVWDSNVLLQVNELNDFAMVVLFTDTIETGRAWIEQVQPALGDVPLLVVSSAQAAPMLQPYLQSGQVQAMLSGMGDGLAYEEILKLPGEERSAFWLANQFGVLAIILVILVGALIEGISSLVGRSRSDEA